MRKTCQLILGVNFELNELDLNSSEIKEWPNGFCPRWSKLGMLLYPIDNQIETMPDDFGTYWIG